MLKGLQSTRRFVFRNNKPILWVLTVLLGVFFWWLIFSNHRLNDTLEAFQVERTRSNWNRINNALSQLDKLDPTALPRAYIQVGQMYRNGVEDRYNSRGRKIQGIKPNLKKAEEYFLKAKRMGLDEATLLLADLYNYDYEILGRARALYEELVYNSNQVYLRRIAMERLGQINDHIPPIHLAPMPTMERHTRVEMPMPPPVAVIRPTVQITPDLLRGDSQNVHDSSVLKTVRESVQRLQQNTPIEKELHTTVREVRNYIELQGDSDKKRDALKTLDKIEKDGGVHLTSANDSELNALNLVWNRINKSAMKDNLKDILFQELAGAVEHGSVVCSTGRYTRIVNTLNGVDSVVQIQPKWAVQQHILNNALAIKKRLENSMGAEYKKAIEAIEPNKEEEVLLEEFKEIYLNELRKETQEFVWNGAMLGEDVEAEINKIVETTI